MNEAASTLSQKGLLKNYYPDEQDSPVRRVLQKKQEKMRDELMDKLELKTEPRETENG